MIGITTKATFFDRKAVTGAVDRTTRRVLSKFGAFVRTGARSSIRKRRAVSAAGQPPSSHAGLLKKLIYFGYEPTRKSVVIGPTPLHGTAKAPPLLEEGGTVDRRDRKGRRRRLRYRARPFMGPALKRELPKLPAMWAGSVK